ncbi:MAG TPA: Mur ligase family protein [Thermomicrobiales bacterium]|nr:Mur ligase family protein [Thermomicrobiales bacterium]
MPIPDPTATLTRFHAAVARVDALIERDNTPHDKSPAEIRARAEMRLSRMAAFLAHLGDPHLRFPVIHITGTSGKGSTSTAVARMLHAAGLRVGLHTSPYLQSPTEKLQLDDRLVAPDRFADLVDTVLVAHDRWMADGNDALTYGEIWVALVMIAFAEDAVDVAVIEVGAGGRFDLTNVVRPAVTTITSVGIDHVVTLGSSIADIAWHKAGIIKPGAPVITAVDDPVALGPINREAAYAGVAVTQVREGVDWRVVRADLDGTEWEDLRHGDGVVYPAVPGRFQAGNAAVALATARAFAGVQGFVLPEDAIRTGLSRGRIPGRFEVIPARDGQPTVILDGAHNPQKVGALVRSVTDLATSDGGLVVVLGALEAKQIDEMVSTIAPVAGTILATSPRVLAKAGADADALAAAIARSGFTGTVIAEPEPSVALERAISIAGPDGAVLVTGSLYLIGNIRGRWYANDAITLQQTPWPGASD